MNIGTRYRELKVRFFTTCHEPDDNLLMNPIKGIERATFGDSNLNPIKGIER